MPQDAEAAWVRAALELAVLAALTEGDRHGYALGQRIAEQGLGAIRGVGWVSHQSDAIASAA